MRTDSVIVVTGSSSGLGRRTAETLARRGHAVYAAMRAMGGRNAAVAAELHGLAAREGLELRVVEMDVGDAASVDAAVHTIAVEAGRVDVAVNNAGALYVGVTEAFTLAQAERQIDVNLFGAARVNRAVLPYMRRQGSGLLVHVSSLAGRLVFPFFGFYCASKFALEALAEAYRYELAGLGIDSVIVEPGPFPTRLIDSNPGPEDERRVAEYGPVGEIPKALLSGFRELFASADAQDPQVVADVIAELVATPAGERPLRTVAGAVDYGVVGLNDAAAPVTAGLLQGMGLGDLSRLRSGARAA